MNGAELAILTDLLAEAKNQSQLLKKLAGLYSSSSGGSGGGGGGAGAAAGLLASFNPLSIAAKLLTGAVNLLIGAVKLAWNIFTGLMTTVGDVANKLAAFGKRAIELGVRMSEVYDQFSDIPIIGSFFRLKGILQSVNEAMYDVYKSTSEVGATFGGSISRASSTASQMGLSLQEFGNVIKKSAPLLAQFSGNVDLGAAKMAALSKEFVFGRDKFQGSVIGLGFTFESANNLLSSYMQRLSTTGAQRNMSDQQIIAGAREYAANLDTLSKLTGEEREQLEEKMRKERNREEFNAYLSTITNENERKKIEMMRDELAVMSPELLDQFYSAVRGVPGPVGKMGEALVMMGETGFATGEAFEKIFRSGGTVAEAQQQFRQLLMKTGMGLNKFMGDNAALAAATGLSGFQIQTLARKAGNNLNEFVRLVTEAQNQTSGAMKGSANTAAANDQAARNLGKSMLGVASAISNSFGGALDKVMNFLLGEGLPILEKVGKALGELTGNVINRLLEYYKIMAGPGEFSDKLKTLFSTIWDDVKKVFQTIWEYIGPPIMNFFRDTVKPWLDSLARTAERKLMELVDKIIAKIPVLGWFADKENPAVNDKNDQLRDADSYLARYDAEMKRLMAVDATKRDQGWIDSFLKLTNNPAELEKQRKLYAEAYSFLWSSVTTRPDDYKKFVQPGTRHSGTIGMTGNWWETESGPKNIQAGETVLTQSQLSQIVDTAGSNKLAEQIDRLNSISAEMLAYLRETARNTADNARATKALNGNVLA